MSHRLYIGNKMMDIPYFNVPWFDMAERALLSVPNVIEVFSPAAHDRKMGFNPMRCPKGTMEESESAGFSRRSALAADWEWIARYSTGMVAGPDWMASTGAKSEVACHHALGLPVWEYDIFLRNWNKSQLWEMLIPPMKPILATLTVVDGPEPGEDTDDGGFFCDCHS